jgi:hypothetical protein
MSQIKKDLICEVIRISQFNLLRKKKGPDGKECDEKTMVEWVKNHAADYRENFRTRLQVLSTTELGEILKTLTRSGKELSDILDAGHAVPSEPGSLPANP